MVSLSQETEALARRLAVAQQLTVEDAIKQALEERARAAGVTLETRPPQRRMSVSEMLSFGAQIASMPVLDPRSPREIMDDLNAL